MTLPKNLSHYTEVDGAPCDYMGDGVYAIHRGYEIEIRENDHNNPVACVISSSALEALNRFDKIVTVANESNNEDNTEILNDQH